MKKSLKDLKEKIKSSNILYRITCQGEIIADNSNTLINFWRRMFLPDKLFLKSSELGGIDNKKPGLELIFVPEEECKFDVIEICCSQGLEIWSQKRIFQEIFLEKTDKLKITLLLEAFWNGE